MANYVSKHSGTTIDAAVDSINNLAPFSGATVNADGSKGLVPAPEIGDQGKFLRGDGTWHAFSAMLTQSGATEGNLAKFDSNGQVIDSGKAINKVVIESETGKISQTAALAEGFTSDGINKYTLGKSVTAADVDQITTNKNNIATLQTDVANLKYQNEWIGRTTCEAGNEQSTLTTFVTNTVSRVPRQGDQVTITNYGAAGQVWMYSRDSGNTYTWKMYTDLTPITNATTTTKGVVQIGDGIKVDGGTITPQLASTAKLTTEATVASSTDTTKNYAVVLDKSGDLAVTVPWTDTHNSHTVTVVSGVKADNTNISGTSGSSSSDISVTLGDSGITPGAYGDSTAQTPSAGGTFKVPYVSVNAKGIINGISEHTVTVPSTYPITISSAPSTKLLITGVQEGTSSTSTLNYNSSVYISTANVLRGAAWNDFAETRQCKYEPGTVVCEVGDGTMIESSKRLQAGAAVISDTYGMLIGTENDDYSPVAVAGRVLVKINPTECYNPGDAVCAGPNGTASVMKRREIRKYPDRIIGYVSEIPVYNEWNGVNINNRIWIKLH